MPWELAFDAIRDGCRFVGDTEETKTAFRLVSFKTTKQVGLSTKIHIWKTDQVRSNLDAQPLDLFGNLVARGHSAILSTVDAFAP